MDDISNLPIRPNQAFPGISGVTTKAQARETAEEFESMFLTQMLAPMFEALDTDGLTGGGSAERAFRPMLIEEYAKEMSAQGGIGLADQVYTEILRMQGLEPDQAPLNKPTE